MGCVLVKICDPPLPDITIRDFWHINGVIIDGCLQKYKALKNSSHSRAGSFSLEVTSTITSNNSGDNCHLTETDNLKNLNSFNSYKTNILQHRPSGVLYVCNGRLIYKSRRCALLSRNAKPLQIEICDIQDVKCLNHFTSNNDGKTYSGKIVDINIVNKESVPFHIGFLTKNAEEISRQLSETCIKHRQKPKIFQFNSVDIDGVEIDFP